MGTIVNIPKKVMTNIKTVVMNQVMVVIKKKRAVKNLKKVVTNQVMVVSNQMKMVRDPKKVVNQVMDMKVVKTSQPYQHHQVTKNVYSLAQHQPYQHQHQPYQHLHPLKPLKLVILISMDTTIILILRYFPLKIWTDWQAQCQSL